MGGTQRLVPDRQSAFVQRFGFGETTLDVVKSGQPFKRLRRVDMVLSALPR
jgi:hypothetical protein